MIAVSDNDITYYGPDKKIEAKRYRRVSEVAKRILALPSCPLTEAHVDVDIMTLSPLWRMYISYTSFRPASRNDSFVRSIHVPGGHIMLGSSNIGETVPVHESG